MKMVHSFQLKSVSSCSSSSSSVSFSGDSLLRHAPKSKASSSKALSCAAAGFSGMILRVICTTGFVPFSIFPKPGANEDHMRSPATVSNNIRHVRPVRRSSHDLRESWQVP